MNIIPEQSSLSFPRDLEYGTHEQLLLGLPDGEVLSREFETSGNSAAHTAPKVSLRGRAALWIVRTKETLAMVLSPVDEPIGTPPEQEGPFAATWREDAVERRKRAVEAAADLQPVLPPRPALARGPWIMSEVKLDVAAIDANEKAEAIRRSHDHLSEGVTRVIAELKLVTAHKIAEAARKTAEEAARAEAERRKAADRVRITELGKRIVAETVTGKPWTSWLNSDQEAVEYVIRNVEAARTAAARRGEVITDLALYRKFKRAADRAEALQENQVPAGDRMQQLRRRGFRVVDALMGSYKGKLPM
jgi:hypothetical protein